MLHTLRTACALVASAALAAGCVLHEEPRPAATAEVEIALRLDPAMEGAATAPDPGDAYARRYTVEALDSRGTWHRATAAADGTVATARMTLPRGTATIAAWSDWVRRSDGAALYSADGAATATMTAAYTACTEARDIFAGTATANIGEASGRVDIDLRRCAARYELVATDAEAFARRIAAEGRDPRGWRVRVEYAEAVATSYSIADGTALRPSAIAYETPLPAVTAGARELTLGFDYCLCAPGGSMTLAADVTILDATGATIASTRTSIALRAGANTTVRGRFLTTAITGGIGIDPDYDGTVDTDLGTLAGHGTGGVEII